MIYLALMNLIALGALVWVILSWREDVNRLTNRLLEDKGEQPLHVPTAPLVRVSYVDEKRESALETKPTELHYAQET